MWHISVYACSSWESMQAGRLNAQNTRGPQGDRLCCSVSRTPVRTGDETGELLGTAATVGHNRLQCLTFAYSLSYRDVQELLAERGITVDHSTIWRWVQRYAPELAQRQRA